MSKGQDFVRFYFENKNEYGSVDFEDVVKNFDAKQRLNVPSKPFVFEDKNGLNFIKNTKNRRITSAEVLMSRIYKKLGFDGAIYYPCSRSTWFDGAVCQSLADDHSGIARDFRHKIFEKSGNVFPQTLGGKNDPKLSGYYSPEAVRQVLLMRLLDTASLNTDRHDGNFILGTKINEEGKPVVTSIKPFDYGDSADTEYNTKHGCFYTNFSTRNDNVADVLGRDAIIDNFKNNETVQMFLPHTESSQILGSIDFFKEAKEVREQTGFEASRYLVEKWQESFEYMAEELSQ